MGSCPFDGWIRYARIRGYSRIKRQMKRLFASVRKINDTDTIVEIIQEIDNIDNEFHPDFVKALVEITSLQPMPELGWVYVDGEFSPRPPPVYTDRKSTRLNSSHIPLSRMP